MATLGFETRPESIKNATSEELMTWVARGDEHALTTLMAKHGGFVQGVAYGVTGLATGSRDAEDFAQEAWIKAWRASSSFKEQGSFCAWIKAIVRNACISEMRKKRIRPWEMQVGEYPDFPITDHPDTSAISPAAVVARRELLDDLADCQSSLNHKQRIALELYNDGATQRQIADVLDISLGGANNLLKRVFCSLRECLEIKGHAAEELVLL